MGSIGDGASLMWITCEGLSGRQTSKQSGRLATTFDSDSNSDIFVNVVPPLRCWRTVQRLFTVRVCAHALIGVGPSVPRTNTTNQRASTCILRSTVLIQGICMCIILRPEKTYTQGRSRSRSLVLGGFVLLFGSSFPPWSFRLCLVFHIVVVFRAVEVTLPV